MIVKAMVINEGTSAQHYILVQPGYRNEVLYGAPNNWKTVKGAERWAKNHGYIVEHADGMGRYVMEIVEKYSVYYTIEAHSAEEASRLFAEWIERHEEEVQIDLDRNFNGRTMTFDRTYDDDSPLDITYAELTEEE